MTKKRAIFSEQLLWVSVFGQKLHCTDPLVGFFLCCFRCVSLMSQNPKLMSDSDDCSVGRYFSSYWKLCLNYDWNMMSCFLKDITLALFCQQKLCSVSNCLKMYIQYFYFFIHPSLMVRERPCIYRVYVILLQIV